MNKFLEAVEVIKEELATMTRQYELVMEAKKEIKIEKEKIVEQNRTLKLQREELTKSIEEAEKKHNQLNEREKVIVAKEKQNVLLDNKIKELQTGTAKMLEEEHELKVRQEEYNKKKAMLDIKTEIYQKMEDTETMRKTRLKMKEEEIDKELERLKQMNA